MLDLGPIRKSYYDQLKTGVWWENSEIPIVDEKLDARVTEHDLYMLIDGQEERPTDNKTRYAAEVDLTITVVHRRSATNSKTAVESIAGQMLAKLFPAKNQWTVAVTSPQSLTYARHLESDYRFEKTDAGFNIMKRMVFRNRITQP